MASYGRQTLGQSGTVVMVLAGGDPIWHAVGITIDWTKVTAVGSDTTLPDGNVIPAGQKGLQYGTVLIRQADGHYAPADNTSTLVRGETVVLNETLLQTMAYGLVGAATDHPGVLEGGLVWKARLGVGGATQPTLANLEAAMPLLRFVQQ